MHWVAPFIEPRNNEFLRPSIRLLLSVFPATSLPSDAASTYAAGDAAAGTTGAAAVHGAADAAADTAADTAAHAAARADAAAATDHAAAEGWGGGARNRPRPTKLRSN